MCAGGGGGCALSYVLEALELMRCVLLLEVEEGGQ